MSPYRDCPPPPPTEVVATGLDWRLVPAGLAPVFGFGFLLWCSYARGSLVLVGPALAAMLLLEGWLMWRASPRQQARRQNAIEAEADRWLAKHR